MYDSPQLEPFNYFIWIMPRVQNRQIWFAREPGEKNSFHKGRVNVYLIRKKCLFNSIYLFDVDKSFIFVAHTVRNKLENFKQAILHCNNSMHTTLN